MLSEYEFPGSNTNYNKLAGTVYDLDFDDDISNENTIDLKAMRERRKSVDIHDKKADTPHTLRDSSASPKFASPSQNIGSKRTYNTDLSDLRPPTPIEKATLKSDASEKSTVQPFPDIVPPVLPGPVDMRTYNNFDPQTYNETNLLNAFSSGTANPPMHEEIDEEEEKELHSALKASLSKSNEPAIPEVSNIKVSLSDSRNQLKVKIKGPISNYTSNTAPPVPVDANIASNISGNPNVNSMISVASASISSGSSNLRRMRKKELLRQYWTQENMDSIPAGVTNTPTAPPRNIITIPKAVASMTTIPTKDDYSNYRSGTDEILETKFKKDKSRGLSRELKHLDLSLDEEGSFERRRSLGSTGSNTSAGLSTSFESTLSNKRRGRPPRSSQTTPKLKIKIGNANNIIGETSIEDKKDRIKPPKKRLAEITKYSVEDLKRDSMKYRKKMMAGFEEKKKRKKEKKEKRKKKKLKQQLQIISSGTVNPTKLIIRFGKKIDSENEVKRTDDGESEISLNVGRPAVNKVGSGENSSVKADKDLKIESSEKKLSESAVAENKTLGESSANCKVSPEALMPELNSTPSALRLVRTNKITPIKLKLSRCQEGSGYIMKSNETSEEVSKGECGEDLDPPPAPPPPLNIADQVRTPLPLNKDCEVR